VCEVWILGGRGRGFYAWVLGFGFWVLVKGLGRMVKGWKGRREPGSKEVRKEGI